jgi:hypothetical protein
MVTKAGGREIAHLMTNRKQSRVWDKIQPPRIGARDLLL